VLNKINLKNSLAHWHDSDSSKKRWQLKMPTHHLLCKYKMKCPSKLCVLLKKKMPLFNHSTVLCRIGNVSSCQMHPYILDGEGETDGTYESAK
jgi:hypothetical protein